MRFGKALAACLVGAMLAQPAMSSTVTIDFETDTLVNVPNGFVSDDSGIVSFTGTNGSNLRIRDFNSQSDGRALGVFPDGPGELQMDFTQNVSGLTLAFGNDDPGFSNPGDRAWLTGWLGGTLVETVNVVMNRDDIMNQTIALTAVVDQAFFYYGDAAGNAIRLIEIVDNISFTPTDIAPIPLPAAGWMLLASLGGLVLMRRRTQA